MAYEVQRVLVAAGAQQAPLPQGQTQSPGTPLLPEILSLFTSSVPLPSSSALTAFARAAAQKDRIAALPLPSREALVANRKPPVVALAAPASSKSIFKGGRPRGSGQCGGGGQGDGRAAVQGRADSSGTSRP